MLRTDLRRGDAPAETVRRPKLGQSVAQIPYRLLNASVGEILHFPGWLPQEGIPEQENFSDRH